MYPNIDNTYTIKTYTGERLVIRTSQNVGIKNFGSMASNMQGLAIWGSIAVRMANVSTSTTHYVYRLSPTGITQIASFVLDGTGHSNALQFSPLIESGQTLPYLYVSGLGDKCYVLSFNASYEATIVQTITISGGNQILMGDDGFIWCSGGGDDDTRRFKKYRHVDVSEGDVTLTDSDLLDSWDTLETYGDGYTAQGWKVKFGKIWFSYGASGETSKKGISVYDTATHRCVAILDFSDYGTREWEDIDFYDNAILAAMYTGHVYIIRT